MCGARPNEGKLLDKRHKRGCAFLMAMQSKRRRPVWARPFAAARAPRSVDWRGFARSLISGSVLFLHSVDIAVLVQLKGLEGR